MGGGIFLGDGGHAPISYGMSFAKVLKSFYKKFEEFSWTRIDTAGINIHNVPKNPYYMFLLHKNDFNRAIGSKIYQCYMQLQNI